MTEELKEKKITGQENRVGVYICYCGGNISDHVDVEKVRDRAEKIPGVTLARTNMFMCSDPGQELIARDLQDGLIDRVVVASCAPSLHEDTFRGTMSRAGVNPYLYEHTNIREQVSWVHHGDEATDKATRLVAASVGKVTEMKPMEPLKVDARPHATVIGGGIAGLRAVKDLATLGFKVVLIEKSPFLGGQTAVLDRVAPAGEEVPNLLSELAKNVLEDPAITVKTCTQVTGFDGYIGNFNLKLKSEPPESDEANEKIKQMIESGKETGQFIPFVGIYPGTIPQMPEESTVETGVVVIATGFRPYIPRSGEYGYKQYEEVVTLPQFIRMISDNRKEGKFLELEGRKIRSIAMIHCVGSRQIPGIHDGDEAGNLNEYCSRTCCSALLFNATQIREEYPGTRVYEFYRDIRAYGRGQEELYSNASGSGVIFLRFEADSSPEIIKNNPSDGYPLQVKVKDTLTYGEEVEVLVDLVVLGVGMEPSPVPELVDMMKLPVGTDRFLLEVHPKLRPVELPVSGIMLAGTCQAPMDIGEACNAAGAAAVKASAILGKGFVEMDPFVAEVDTMKCRGCGACVEACLKPGALNMVETEVNGEIGLNAGVFPALCSGCGACVAVCEENAINISGWTLKQYENMVDMIVSDQWV